MTNRVLDFSSRGVRLSARGELLVVEADHLEIETIPFDDIAVALATHRETLFTQAVLSRLAKSGASFITCDERSMPAAMLLPLRSHWSQTERFVRQAALPATRRKRLWQQVVQAKIGAQGRLLRELHGSDFGLEPMKRRVRSGDTNNAEAQASRRYWLLLFSDSKFHRGDDQDSRNSLLNYGYAVLRAATARALCACGLHPSFGLHHSNKLNAFVLADDLMEPFRPCIDRAVVALSHKIDGRPTLSPETKTELIATVTGRYLIGGEQRTLFDILTRLAQSLAAVVQGAGSELWLPDWEAVE